MRKLHEKSIILGIGIGMIITAIAGMIYTAGTSKEPTKEEIMKLAKGYGMVEQTQIIKNGDMAKQAVKDTEQQTNSKDVAQQTEADKSTVPAETTESATASTTPIAAAATTAAADISTERNIVVEVKSGEKAYIVAQKLLEKEVIANLDDFIDFMKANNATTKIIRGNYKFKKNDDFDYIVKTICRAK